MPVRNYCQLFLLFAKPNIAKVSLINALYYTALDDLVQKFANFDIDNNFIIDIDNNLYIFMLR